jgi:hypothetical protein
MVHGVWIHVHRSQKQDGARILCIRPHMTVQQEFCCANVELSESFEEEGRIYLLSRLVKHLALRRQRSRPLDEVV